MKELVNSFGGWPVADKRWSSKANFSMEVLLGQLKHELNEGILFEVWVGPDDKNSSLHVIQVRIGKTFLYQCIIITYLNYIFSDFLRWINFNLVFLEENIL